MQVLYWSMNNQGSPSQRVLTSLTLSQSKGVVYHVYVYHVILVVCSSDLDTLVKEITRDPLVRDRDEQIKSLIISKYFMFSFHTSHTH